MAENFPEPSVSENLSPEHLPEPTTSGSNAIDILILIVEAISAILN